MISRPQLPGGVLQRNHIHIAVCESGSVGTTLKALRNSPKTAAKAKFILTTDDETLEAEDLGSGETITSEYRDFPHHFGFFLPLAGISTIKEIKDNGVLALRSAAAGQWRVAVAVASCLYQLPGHVTGNFELLCDGSAPGDESRPFIGGGEK